MTAVPRDGTPPAPLQPTDSAAARGFSARLDAVSVVRGGRAILDGATTQLTGRGVTALIGPNGSGKTTLLKLLNGLVAPDAGRVVWFGPDGETSPLGVRQAMLLQQPALLRRTAAANLVFAAKRAGVPRSDRRSLAARWLDKAGLSALAESPARRLSGGEQRRLALARALILAPQALILDEPGAGLDPAATRALEALIADAAASGVKVVFSTHDVGQVRRLADEALFLNAGRLEAAGLARDLLDDPPVVSLAAFLKGDLLC
ncbi:MAG: ATP-binding cassette domain-containing protein [Alphaproteobacteria bacterium]|nr:ATP-binding cassette domain-containing protein [Alphaproteobacteria bacterium]